MNFKSLRDEQFREYVFPNGVVKINNPIELDVSKSGGHRVLDKQGVSHYVPPTWIHLSWKVKPGKKAFAF